jgi:hypothetical protein
MKPYKTIVFIQLCLLTACVNHQSDYQAAGASSASDYSIAYEPLPPDYKILPPNSPIGDLSRVFGFIYGQEYAISKISETFPEYSNVLLYHQAEFNIQFKTAVEKITKELESALGSDFNKLKSDLEKRIYEINLPSTHAEAIAFIDLLENRSKGDIESPVREILLTYQFLQNPAREQAAGFSQHYSTAGHPKAKGLTLNFKLPASWHKKEGDRPNIINKFISYNGNEIILFMVRDLGLPSNYKITQDELNEFFVEDELKEMIPGAASFISAKPIKLDGNLGGQIIYSIRGQRLDSYYDTQFVMFTTIHNNQMIMMQCAVHAVDDENLDHRFRLFFPLFRQVANSMVIVDKYK